MQSSSDTTSAEPELLNSDVEPTTSTYFLSGSLQRTRSFVSSYSPNPKWEVVSPMSHHVLRETLSPARLRRRRSRSFNDYIEERRTHKHQQSHPLTIPSLKELRQSSTFSPETCDKTTPPDSNALTTSASGDREKNPAWVCGLYGMINATIVLPVVMSFGSIIYQDEAFVPYTPVLIKLTLVSGLVHQLCFSTFSSLPFAVGSVQDAGLIFLSSMASDMAAHCKSQGRKDEVMLATVTVGLSCGTAVLGCCLILIGRLQLAGYVQMLPTCVVAGYLAFIGWFCGKSGVSLMAGSNSSTWLDLWENLHLILPGVLGALFLYCSIRIVRHVAVLPTVIAILLGLFYVTLAIKGSTIAEATKEGWIRAADPAPVWYHSWDYLKVSNVDWSAIPQCLLTELSMILVVALSSSLDVAAIELEMKRPLDFNGELTMVGLSNLISGLSGGYTGSYIFSQSIFTLRAGIRSRLAGLILAFCQVLVIVSPFPLLTLVPNFFYGALLGMICLDLMYEWLWEIREKVTVAEYIIGLTTFGMIQFVGVEYGILLGVGVYFACRQSGVDVGELKMMSSQSIDQEEEDEYSVAVNEQSSLLASSSGAANHPL